jgi:isopenicillin N synthase-like dioxygenase
MAAEAKSLVPIIDVSALIGSDATKKKETAMALRRACEDIGFFVVVNHGIPKEIVDACWRKTEEFFDSPMENKKLLISPDAAKDPYGYSAFGGETLSLGKTAEKEGEDAAKKEAPATGDLKEMFCIGPSDPGAQMAPRRLPARPEGFSSAWEMYYDEVHKLAQRILGAFAISLGLKEDWFEDKMDRHCSALRANNYPNQDGMSVPEGSIRCSAHTDYGTVTVLRSGGPGLQVCKDLTDRTESAWSNVPFIEDSFCINLGDLMRRWTNEKWCSTLHRVINPPASEAKAWGRRLSLAFFHNLNKDAVVEAIPACVSETEPRLYDPIVAGEFLMLKHLASQGKAPKDAHLKKRSLNGEQPEPKRAAV